MIETTIKEHLDVVNGTFNKSFERILEEAASIICNTFKLDGKLIFCGNGGSAADSQHISAEFVSKLKDNREALAAVSLTVDTSAITAVGNDYGFENIFSRQLKAIGRPEDTLIAITTSGRSQNIINAVHTALKNKINVIVLTGEKGIEECANMEITELRVRSSETARIQEVHIIIGHLLCAISEKAYL